MSIPDMDAWRARWERPERKRLGVRGERVEDGVVVLKVDLRYGDEREGDRLFAAAAVTHAVDSAAAGAVNSHLDDDLQQQNGTASLNIHFLAPLSGVITVESRLLSWGSHEAVVEVVAHDEQGTLVLKALTGYSIRPRAPRTEAGSESVNRAANG